MFLFDEQYLVCRGESISSLSNISINKKPVFFSEVVIYGKVAPFITIHRRKTGDSFYKLVTVSNLTDIRTDIMYPD